MMSKAGIKNHREFPKGVGPMGSRCFCLIGTNAKSDKIGAKLNKIGALFSRVCKTPAKIGAYRRKSDKIGHFRPVPIPLSPFPEGPKIEKIQDFAPGLKLSSDQSQIEIFNRD